MEYSITTPRTEAARKRNIALLREEMARRSNSKGNRFAQAVKRFLNAIAPALLITILTTCMLAASYGDTLAGINPS